MTANSISAERFQFLSQTPEQLVQLRGRQLYEALNELGITHEQFLRAANLDNAGYFARAYGLDLAELTLERFYNGETRYHAPSMFAGAVRKGLNQRSAFPDLITSDENVSSAVIDVPYIEEDIAGDTESQLRTVAPGAAIPETGIRAGQRAIRLDKKGRGISASYEDFRRSPLEEVLRHFTRAGERLGRQLDARLAQVLTSGDGSGASTTPEVTNTAEAGEWSYEDLLTAFLSLSVSNYFTPTHMLVGPESGLAILQLPEFKDSALFEFKKSGQLPTPFGVKLITMPDHPGSMVTFLDANYAVKKFTEQDLLVENDKLINQQWDRTFMTVVTDFGIVYNKARVVLNSDWS